VTTTAAAAAYETAINDAVSWSATSNTAAATTATTDAAAAAAAPTAAAPVAARIRTSLERYLLIDDHRGGA